MSGRECSPCFYRLLSYCPLRVVQYLRKLSDDGRLLRVQHVISDDLRQRGQISQRGHTNPLPRTRPSIYRAAGERRRVRTTDGMCATMLFLSIVETRLAACSARSVLSFPADVAAAWNVSMTLARISLSGSSSPRRSKGINCARIHKMSDSMQV